MILVIAINHYLVNINLIYTYIFKGNSPSCKDINVCVFFFFILSDLGGHCFFNRRTCMSLNNRYLAIFLKIHYQAVILV